MKLAYSSIFISLVVLILSQTALCDLNEKDEKTEPATKSVVEERKEETTGHTFRNMTEKAIESTEATLSEVTQVFGETRLRREAASSFLLLNYSPLDLLIPNKIGLSMGVIKNADKTWELEYLSGSVSVPFIVDNLGQMTDERLSVIGRAYLGANSFNLNYGLSYFRYSLHLGSDILSRVNGGTTPSMDLVEVQSLGLNFGLGNRWTFKKNITFGVDWFSWSQPLYAIKKQAAYLDGNTNQSDRDSIEKALGLITYFPRLTLLKIQLGILF